MPPNVLRVSVKIVCFFFFFFLVASRSFTSEPGKQSIYSEFKYHRIYVAILFTEPSTVA